MSGYEAVIGSIHRAADAAHSAADQIAGIDPGGDLGSAVSSSLPGAAGSIGAARSVSEAWKGRGKAIANGLRGFGDDLHSAADAYAANENAAQENLELPTQDRPSGGAKAV